MYRDFVEGGHIRNYCHSKLLPAAHKASQLQRVRADWSRVRCGSAEPCLWPLLLCAAAAGRNNGNIVGSGQAIYLFFSTISNLSPVQDRWIGHSFVSTA